MLEDRRGGRDPRAVSHSEGFQAPGEYGEGAGEPWKEYVRVSGEQAKEVVGGREEIREELPPMGK